MSVRPTKIGRRYGHFLIHSLLIADMQQASLDRWAWKSAARDLLGFRPEEVIGSFRPAATSGIFVEARRADIAAERQIRRAGCELMKPKPGHLGPKFGAQFGDRSVAENYKTRNPYPRALFDVLLQLSSGSPNPILDLGCGTGDIALEIASRSTKVVCGVDPSRAMLDVARTRAERENASNVRWFHESAETFRFEGPYSLVVAGESLHWMEWDLVMPRIARSLCPGAHFVVVDGREFEDPPWKADLLALLPQYSTNQQFRPYDLIEELTSRGLFRELGRETIIGGCVSQSLDNYIESFHTRNGFSRERMAPGQAESFDHAVRSLLKSHAREGTVSGVTTTRVVWGLPVSA